MFIGAYIVMVIMLIWNCLQQKMISGKVIPTYTVVELTTITYN